MVRGIAVAGVCALAMVVASPASADTVEITRGTASLYWDGSLTSFTIANGDSQFLSEYYGQARIGFNGGDTVDLSTTIPVTNAGNHTLRETFHNHEYQAWLSGSLYISAKPFVAPVANGDGSTFQGFTTPFKASGWIYAYATSDRTGPPLFQAYVIGFIHPRNPVSIRPRAVGVMI